MILCYHATNHLVFYVGFQLLVEKLYKLHPNHGSLVDCSIGVLAAVIRVNNIASYKESADTHQLKRHDLESIYNIGS
jgi:hypothetical protein